MQTNMNNDAVKENIYGFLKEGLHKKDAAIMAGIDESTFYRWIESDASFASRVEASILEYKHTLVKNVNTSAIKDGKLALEVLKRRFPKEWGDNASVIEIREGFDNERKEVREWLEGIYKREREKNIEDNIQPSHQG